MEESKGYLGFTQFALQDIHCCKCNRVIKKDSFCHPIAALKPIDTIGEFKQYNDDDFLCEDCYGDHLIKSMDRLGISVVDENGQWRNFSEVLKQFCEIWGKIEKEESNY